MVELKIGDEVFIHGYIDEVRPDTIIIRNSYGYFGTDKYEVYTKEEIINEKDNMSSMQG